MSIEQGWDLGEVKERR